MLAKNYESVLENIRQSMAKAGRFDTIELLAASKTQDIETMRAAHGLGICVFGENRVQELLEKYTTEFTFDMIGQLQTNKVKSILGKVRLIQSVDRLSLAEVIDKEARKLGIKQKILVEINGGEESDKGGVFPLNALDFIKSLRGYENIEVCGIMAVMPKSEDFGYLKSLYQNLFETRKTILEYDKNLYLYSAGMSNDYTLAVEYGANIIRLGRALFGERW